MEGDELEKFGYRQELKREITWKDVFVYSLVFMVPIAPWGIYGIVSNVSGGMPALAYLIGMVGMLPTAFAYFIMVREFPLAGSVYNYAQRAVHPYYGFISGMLILLDYILVPGLVYLVAGLAMNALVPQVPYWAWVLIFLVPMTLVSILGIKPTARINMILLAVELIALAMFIAMTLMYIFSNHIQFTLTPFYNSSNFTVSTVLNATSIAVLSYLGFDAATTLAEENRGKASFVGRAVVLSVFLIGIIFISQTYLAYVAYPVTFSNPDTGFYEVASAVGGFVLLTTVTLSTAIAWGVGDGLAATTAIARVIYAMGRDGFLPRLIAKVHPRFGTPWIATVIGAGLSTAVAIIVPLDTLSSLVNFGALSAFILMHVAVFYYFGYRKKNVMLTLPSIAGIVVLGLVWWGLSTDAKILGFSWLAFWIVYSAILTRGFREIPKVPE